MSDLKLLMLLFESRCCFLFDDCDDTFGCLDCLLEEEEEEEMGSSN